MLLSGSRRQSKGKSISCSLLQKQIEKEHKELKASRRASNPEFIPYCLQRKLGKLIIKNESLTNRKPSNSQLLEKITFRNFHKIYQLVSKYENVKYSEMTRKPQQRNLINKQWKVHTLAKLPPKTSLSLSRSAMHSSASKLKSVTQREHFSKMNEHLFKKINLVQQPKAHPEYEQMYKNYIQICEINENIRRQQLLKGIKDK